jgi:hypothetical protein
MFSRAFWIAKAIALLTAVLLTAPAARAQTSAAGHVPAPRVSASYNLRGLPSFGIYPGDHMFQATMKIQSTYQAAEHATPAVVYRRPTRPVVREEAAVQVDIAEPAGPLSMSPFADRTAKFVPSPSSAAAKLSRPAPSSFVQGKASIFWCMEGVLP